MLSRTFFHPHAFVLKAASRILMKCDKFPAATSILGPGFGLERGKVLTYVEEAAGRLCRTSGLCLLMLTHLFNVSLFDLSAEDTDNTRWASMPACTSCSCMCVYVCVCLTLLYFSFFVSAHRSSCPLSVWRARDRAACLRRLVPLCLHKSRILRGITANNRSNHKSTQRSMDGAFYRTKRTEITKRTLFNSLSESLFDNRTKTSWKEHLKHVVYSAANGILLFVHFKAARLLCAALITPWVVLPQIAHCHFALSGRQVFNRHFFSVFCCFF